MSLRTVLAGESIGGRLPALAAVVGALVLPLSGCGASDFPNDPRPPAPDQTTASIDRNKVTVSPDKFGAGPVVFTIANLSNDPVTFSVRGGPAGLSRQVDVSTGQIQPSGTASLKTDLKQGTYQANASGAGGIKPASVEVGRERPSSQNKLLLP